MGYDEAYRKTRDYFGQEPTPVLKKYYHLIAKTQPVLDVGVGQGRNALFLARNGFTVDAIDTSRVAIDTVSAIVAKEKVPIRNFQCGFDSFIPSVDYYSGILLLGLFQDISRNSMDILIQKIRSWIRRGSLIFVTAFTTQDPSFSLRLKQWKSIGKNSFVDENGHTATYLEPGEILELFSGYRMTHHWEGPGRKHRHGDGPLERHGLVEGVFQR